MKSKLLVILLAAVLLVAGCSVESRRDCWNNTNQLTAATNICTRIIPQANAETKLGMGHFVAIGDECNRQWVNYHLNHLTPPPDIIGCSVDALLNLYLLNGSSMADVPAEAVPDEGITDEQLISARLMFDLAVKNFQAAMLAGMQE